MRQEVVGASPRTLALLLRSECPWHRASLRPGTKCRHIGTHLLLKCPDCGAQLAVKYNIHAVPAQRWTFFSISPSVSFPILKRTDSKLATSPNFFLFIHPGFACITRLDRGLGQAHLPFRLRQDFLAAFPAADLGMGSGLQHAVHSHDRFQVTRLAVPHTNSVFFLPIICST